MKIRSFLIIGATAIAVTLLAAPAYALSLTDAGVVGAASGETKDDFCCGAVDIATGISNHLLAMGENDSDPDGCALNGTDTCYKTGPNPYSGTVSGGTEVGGGTFDGASSFEYVLAKYNGNNAGYVLYHIPSLAPGFTLPLLPTGIWQNNRGTGYALSHFVGFGSTSTRTPDGGATLSLLGLALAGIGVVRRYVGA
jgi:VPDSG-CTERM motif